MKTDLIDTTALSTALSGRKKKAIIDTATKATKKIKVVHFGKKK